MTDHDCSASRYYHGRHNGCEGCRELALARMAARNRRRRQGTKPEIVTDWMDDAACKGADPNTFVPDFKTRHHARPERQLAEAQAVCATCPVNAACGNYGRTARLSGVYGGELLVLGRRSQRHEEAA